MLPAIKPQEYTRMETTAETLPLCFLLLIKEIYGNQGEESSAQGTGKK